MNLPKNPYETLENLSFEVGFRHACFDMERRADDENSKKNWQEMAKRSVKRAQKMVSHLLSKGVDPMTIRTTVITGEVPTTA